MRLFESGVKLDVQSKELFELKLVKILGLRSIVYAQKIQISIPKREKKAMRRIQNGNVLNSLLLTVRESLILQKIIYAYAAYSPLCRRA